MKRTILSVAYPLTEVGTDAVGGSEQILALLDRAITNAGHRSLVIAAEGSRIQGRLIAAPRATGPLDDSVREWGRGVHHQLIKECLAKHEVDLVHMHSLDFHGYLPPSPVNVLATLHLPPDWYPSRIYNLRQPNFHMNCVSHSQRRSCPPSANMLDPIPNGVDVDTLECRAPKRGFALAMGRICPEKGFHFALDAARATGCDLMLAGEVFPYDSHVEYFRTEVVPRLDSQRTFVGPLRFEEKRRLLAEAKCLVIPSTVAETSSLVAMEAMACGTPVVAFRVGALPEVVEHGRTGFLVSNVDEMAKALRDVEALDPEVCRETARRRFSATAMTDEYLSLYESLIANAEKQQSQWAGGWAANS